MNDQWAHRILTPLEKRLRYGKTLSFLTGDAINERDNYVYDVYYGIRDLAETLKLHFLNPLLPDHYDWFVHIHNASTQINIFKSAPDGIVQSTLEELFRPPSRKGPLPRKRERQANIEKEAENAANQAADNPDLTRLNETVLENSRRMVIFWENLELIAKLYETPPAMKELSYLRDWQRYRQSLIIASISDMETLTKYAFPEDSIFVGNPSANEIYTAFWRYLLRNCPDMRLDLFELERISEALSAGKKSLNGCMRILTRVLADKPETLERKNFEDSIERGIEEPVTWNDVLLEEDVLGRIREQVEGFLEYARHGDASMPAPNKAIILCGPPGTGKTYIAKALANEADCYFMHPTLADMKGEYVGQSSAKIRKLFAEARANEPAIIFIDEADTVFPQRDAAHGDSYGLDMVNQFLQEMDGAGSGQQKIFVIAATNRLQAIDNAVMSRLGKPIDIPLPGRDLRLRLFDAQLARFGSQSVRTIKGACFEELLLDQSDGMSGRDIKGFMNRLRGRIGDALLDNEETKKHIQQVFVQERAIILNQLHSVLGEGNILPPGKNRKRGQDVIANRKVFESLLHLAKYVTDSEIRNSYEKFGVKVAKGFLLYGPPGNGKTHMVESLAGESGFFLFKVLSNDFSGYTSKMQLDNLDAIINLSLRFSRMLNEDEGLILFFDEIDSLAGRDVLSSPVRAALLTYLSDEAGLRSDKGRIMLISATNFPEKLDEAVTRRGRIDQTIAVENPIEAEGIAFLEELIKEDGENLEPVKRSIVEKAWHSLHQEKAERQNAFEKMSSQLGIDGVNNTNASNPSIADLRELFRELKEIAFINNSFNEAEDKLVINDVMLQKRFAILPKKR